MGKFVCYPGGQKAMKTNESLTSCEKNWYCGIVTMLSYVSPSFPETGWNACIFGSCDGSVTDLMAPNVNGSEDVAGEGAGVVDAVPESGSR
jgi:hypothetical protein